MASTSPAFARRRCGPGRKCGALIDNNTVNFGAGAAACRAADSRAEGGSRRPAPRAPAIPASWRPPRRRGRRATPELERAAEVSGPFFRRGRRGARAEVHVTNELHQECDVAADNKEVHPGQPGNWHRLRQVSDNATYRPLIGNCAILCSAGRYYGVRTDVVKVLVRRGGSGRRPNPIPRRT